MPNVNIADTREVTLAHHSMDLFKTLFLPSSSDSQFPTAATGQTLIRNGKKEIFQQDFGAVVGQMDWKALSLRQDAPVMYFFIGGFQQDLFHGW